MFLMVAVGLIFFFLSLKCWFSSNSNVNASPVKTLKQLQNHVYYQLQIFQYEVMAIDHRTASSS